MKKVKGEGCKEPVMKEIAGIPEGQLVKVNLKDPNDPGFRAFATIIFHLLQEAKKRDEEVKVGSPDLSSNTLHLSPQKKACPEQSRRVADP